jgi:hypothetical protein
MRERKEDVGRGTSGQMRHPLDLFEEYRRSLSSIAAFGGGANISREHNIRDHLLE